jgi:cupin 2 domain-containing protein
MKIQNLFAADQVPLSEERFEQLVCGGQFRIERIISTGQTTPPGAWYDQETDEWVVLLAGAAHLQIEGAPDLVHLQPGDAIDIPAHQKHRVEWTDPERATVWLAVHYTRGFAPQCGETASFNRDPE